MVLMSIIASLRLELLLADVKGAYLQTVRRHKSTWVVPPKQMWTERMKKMRSGMGQMQQGQAGSGQGMGSGMGNSGGTGSN